VKLDEKDVELEEEEVEEEEGWAEEDEGAAEEEDFFCALPPLRVLKSDWRGVDVAADSSLRPTEPDNSG